MNSFKSAQWITSAIYSEVSPIDVFKKEMSDKEITRHDDKYKNNHMLVRKVFNIDSVLKDTKINITADDYYKLYINGNFIGQGPAQSYYFSYNFNTYEISKYLVEGENIIAVHVFYQGEINRAYNSGDLRQGIIAEIFDENGSVLATDGSWMYTQAREFTSLKTIAYDTQFEERIDERLKIRGWKKPDFDDSNWQNVKVKTNHDYTFIKQITPPLSFSNVYPKKTLYRDNNKIVLDFGKELVGYLGLFAKGTSGQKIEIRYGEELVDEAHPSVRYDMRCTTMYQDIWTLSGGEDIYEPYEYKAFRYVEILGDISVLNIEDIYVLLRHYPFDSTKCLFDSKNEKLNAIWDICRWGVVLGSQEVFVDCPQREKGQYLGDATVTASSHLYLSGDARLYKKALKDFALSSFICPGLMSVAPGSLMQEIADYSLQYPHQLLTYYMHTGDIDFLKEIYPIAKKSVQYFDRYKRNDGLLINVYDKWNLVDWPQNSRDGYDFDLSKPVTDGCHNVINAFYIGAVQSIEKIEDILNISCQSRVAELIESYRKAFYSQRTGLFVDSDESNHSSLHSNALALYFGAVSQIESKSIVDFINKKRLSCGVYMAYFVLKGLAKYGEYDLVYDIISSDDENSWNTMIKEGATACFEAWSKDAKWNTSLCHPWASAPIPVLIEDILGLKPKTAGWGEIDFAPHIPISFPDTSLELTLPSGRVKVEYKNKTAKLLKL